MRYKGVTKTKKIKNKFIIFIQIPKLKYKFLCIAYNVILITLEFHSLFVIVLDTHRQCIYETEKQVKQQTINKI